MKKLLPFLVVGLLLWVLIKKVMPSALPTVLGGSSSGGSGSTPGGSSSFTSLFGGSGSSRSPLNTGPLGTAFAAALGEAFKNVTGAFSGGSSPPQGTSTNTMPYDISPGVPYVDTSGDVTSLDVSPWEEPDFGGASGDFGGSSGDYGGSFPGSDLPDIGGVTGGEEFDGIFD